MKIEQKNLTKNKSSLKVIFNESDYTSHYLTSLKEYSKKMNLKGFRKNDSQSNTNKINVIKKLHGKPILINVLKNLADEYLRHYIYEKNLHLLDKPLITLTNLDEYTSQDFENPTGDVFFDYEIITPSDFEISISKDLKVEYLVPKEVDDDYLNLLVDRMTRIHGKLTPIEISEEDSVLYGKVKYPSVDFVSNTDLPIQYLKNEVKDKFIGVKKGDKIEFDPKDSFKDNRWLVNLPDEIISNSAADNKRLIFQVDDVAKPEARELDKEFFKEIYKNEEIANQKQFKERLKKDLFESKRQTSDHLLFTEIRKMLIDKTDISLPEDVLLKNLNLTKADLLKPKESKEFEDYKRELKLKIITDKIAKDNNIENLTEEDLLEVYQKSMQGYANFKGQDKKTSIQMMNEHLKNLDERSRYGFIMSVKLEKIFKFIRETITLEQREVSLRELDDAYVLSRS